MNLVFASGFLVPQRFLGFDYFRGIKAQFEVRHETLLPVVSPLAGTAKRSHELADAIHRTFPDGEIHIIAHSMGGLDSRVLIAQNLHGLSDPGRIASLTTLSTPHRGSPVADLIADPKPNGPHGAILDEAVALMARFGVDTGAISDLTTAGASRLPDVAKTHQHIRYRSYFAAGRPGPRATSGLLAATHQFVQDVTGQKNDGVVALESASYGDFQTPFWECDHAEMVGYNFDNIPNLGGSRFDHHAHFEEIVAGL
jgi:triacylglycerol lipase